MSIEEPKPKPENPKEENREGITGYRLISPDGTVATFQNRREVREYLENIREEQP